MNQYKGGPIFTTVDQKNKDNLLRTTDNELYTWQRWDATKRRGERHRNREDFDSISERLQNHNPELIHTIGEPRGFSDLRMEAIEHEVGEPRGFSSQVQEEQERTKVE